MATDFADLLSRCEPDDWRLTSGFSEDLRASQIALFESNSDDTAIDILSKWLQQSQPCLFGRIAAKAGLLSYCIIREEELTGRPELLRDKIQSARSKWTRRGFKGKASGFIILLISKTLATARPDENVKRIATELASYYLLRDIQPDEVYHDEIFLEKPAPSRTTWKWLAGVNYFSAQGDGRWWRDHRIPGGIAFSVNSVGHLVKSGLMGKAVAILNELLEDEDDLAGSKKITSLGHALELAMRTINMAASTSSGRATELLERPKGEDALGRLSCPTSLPEFLQDRDYCQYRGWYHTDITVPSEYFCTDVDRPADKDTVLLDFTYLFDADISNPDYVTMGKGRKIRLHKAKSSHLQRVVPQSVAINRNPRLLDAIGNKIDDTD